MTAELVAAVGLTVQPDEDERSRRERARYGKKWRLDRLRGIAYLVDPAPARDHIEELLAAGFSLRAIADAARLSPTTLSRIRRQLDKQIKRHVNAAILAVTVEKARDRQGRGFVPAVGYRRRIHALYAIGHTAESIAAASSLDASAIRNALNGPGEWITAEKAEAIGAAYDMLWSLPGPSPQNRGRARNYGWAPPLSWDDDTIDDPEATASGAVSVNLPMNTATAETIARYEAGESVHDIAASEGISRAAIYARLKKVGYVVQEDRYQDLAEEVDHLLGFGTSIIEITTRLGYRTQEGLAGALKRAGRTDLASRIEAPRRNVA